MTTDCARFTDLFDQLGLPSEPAQIAAFIARHRPLRGDMAIADASFWTPSQAAFLREKERRDEPPWNMLIDQLGAALSEADVAVGAAAQSVRLLGISGSLRRASFNTALLRAVQRQAQSVSGIEFELATLHGIPLYDGDLESASGLPPQVLTLRQQMALADGVILATPEYNNGVPGVLKNAIDWLSRTEGVHPDVLAGRPVALMGATIGNAGTALSQAHWLPVLRTLGMLLWPGKKFLLSKANATIQDGAITDQALLGQISAFVDGFAAFARLHRQPTQR